MTATQHERQYWRVPLELQGELIAAIRDWDERDKTKRLWNRDATLWTDSDEANWLGWLTIAEEQLARIGTYDEFAAEVHDAGFKYVLLMGMGGSVLCAEVLARTFGKIEGFPQLLMLDSTVPASIARIALQIDYRKTLFIVSSKSGTTLEVEVLREFFYHEAKKVVGSKRVGTHFVAVTDPGTPLHKLGEAQGFRRVFLSEPSVGGRFSALSPFGMVPAAAMGLNVAMLLTRTQQMVNACGPDASLVEENPGVTLGLFLGVCGNYGRDKITLITSPSVENFGAWVEQLLAESTGKRGKGLIPINQEELSDPGTYANDRVFCYMRHNDRADPTDDAKIAALEMAGHPIAIIDVPDKYDLGQEFFRWEIAVATAGAVLGINPFDQPDVEASKIATHQLAEEYQAKRAFPAEAPLARRENIKLFTDVRNEAELMNLAHGKWSFGALLKAHLDRLQPRNYFALLAFVDMTPENAAALQSIRHAVRHTRHIATSLGFGPRYLHSIGQVFKGGPNTGVFIQVTADETRDLRVPNRPYTFGVIKTAQALGDFRVLAERGRRVLRVHLGGDVEDGLLRLRQEILSILL